MPTTPPADVAAVFETYPPALRTRLLELRELILATADTLEGVGEIEEALRWGEPAYRTSRSKSGSTVRIGPMRGSPDEYAAFFNCQTSLVEMFRHWFPGVLRLEGNRAIVFHIDDPLPREAVAECVAAALTYHRTKRRGRSRSARGAGK